jgi:hypothetical protein
MELGSMDAQSWANNRSSPHERGWSGLERPDVSPPRAVPRECGCSPRLDHQAGGLLESTAPSRASLDAHWLPGHRWVAENDDEVVGWTALSRLRMLLTDRFEAGVTARLRNRTQALLRGVRGTRRYQAAVEALYVARSETVHEGKTSRLDLYDARQAFVLCFLKIMRHMPQLREGSSAHGISRYLTAPR